MPHCLFHADSEEDEDVEAHPLSPSSSMLRTVFLPDEDDEESLGNPWAGMITSGAGDKNLLDAESLLVN